MIKFLKLKNTQKKSYGERFKHTSYNKPEKTCNPTAARFSKSSGELEYSVCILLMTLGLIYYKHYLIVK